MMLGKTSLKIRGFRLMVSVLFILPLLAGAAGRAAASGNSGAVYTMTNSATGNAIQEYERSGDGTLTPGGTFSTGGLGTGTGLGSQEAIALSSDGAWLFAVNAGSNEISSFMVQPGQLTLVDKIASGGSDPISLAYYPGLLYVLNAGNGGNITGFWVSPDGRLSHIPGSTRLLSNQGVGSAPSPEEISFNLNGELLVVTEKGSNRIDTYAVVNGLASRPQVHASSGPAPYGFGFSKNNTLIVSEAAQSAASSYKVSDDNFRVISGSIIDHQAAACWLVVTANRDFAYAANAASGNLSGYRVSSNGRLTLLNADGITGITGAGSHPIDMGLSSDNSFLYVLDAGTQMISAFRVNTDGSLGFIANFNASLGAGISGLAAR
ncbi:MAG: lactonase family protein [Omnitrophica WOR_2 bacterium]